MNSKEFEEISQYLGTDTSAEFSGEPSEGEDSRYFGYSTRHYDVVGTLNSFDSKGWMAQEGYEQGEVRDDSPRLRLLGHTATRDERGFITRLMTFEDLNARPNQS